MRVFVGLACLVYLSSGCAEVSDLEQRAVKLFQHPRNFNLAFVVLTLKDPVIRDNFTRVAITYTWQRTHVAPPIRYRCRDRLLYDVPKIKEIFHCGDNGGVFTCKTGNCLLEEIDPNNLENVGDAAEVNPNRKRELLPKALYRFRMKGEIS